MGFNTKMVIHDLDDWGSYFRKPPFVANSLNLNTLILKSHKWDFVPGKKMSPRYWRLANLQQPKWKNTRVSTNTLGEKQSQSGWVKLPMITIILGE